ncbi:MAG: PIN domain-containing protein [Cyanobacteria bacterium]|nr:PIN domain-containing protein [Cyanobacteriota bacterium]
MGRALMLLLDTNILIDVLRGEAIALAWLEQQEHPAISVISWIEVLVVWRPGWTPYPRSRWAGCCILTSSESW